MKLPTQNPNAARVTRATVVASHLERLGKMKSMKAFVLLITFIGAVTVARGDWPAMAFYVVESARLKTLVSESSIAKVSEGKLEEVAVILGHLRGGGFAVRTSESDIRVELRGYGDESQLSYSVAVYSRRERKSLYQLFGRAKADGGYFVTEKWQQADFAVVFRHVDLKK